MGILQDAMRGGQQQGQPQQGQPQQGQPQQGQPQQGQPAPGGGDVDSLLKQATEILYSDNFESMIAMFQQHGKEGFPDAMATAVNGTLDRLEADNGPMEVTVVAQVGVGIFEMILEDLSEAEVLPEIDKNDVLMSLEKILTMWKSNHPDQIDPEEAKMMIEEMARGMAEEGMLDSELGGNEGGM